MAEETRLLVAESDNGAALPFGKLLSTKEVAACLGVSERTVWTLSHGDPPELPPIQIGRQVRFDPRDVEAFIHRKKSKPEAA